MGVSCLGTSFVSAATLSKLVLSKNEVTLEIGETASLTATAVYTDGSTGNVTILADWSSNDPTVATVYNGTITAKKEGVATIVGIYNDLPQSVQVTVTKKVKALTKNIQTIELRDGESAEIALTATYSDNTTENVSTKAEWTTSDEKVATVVNGVVNGEGSGTAVITASYGKQSVAIDVNVEIVKRLEASHNQLSMLLNDTEAILVTAFYPDGTTRDVTGEAEWTSSDEAVADVLNGVVKAYSQGQATLTAAYGTKTAAIEVDVDKTSKLEVDEQKLFMRLDATKQLRLNAIYPDERTSNVTSSAVWASSDEDVASVYKGLIRANGPGVATITAEYGNKTLEIEVDVEMVRYLDITEQTIALEKKETKQLVLQATYVNGVQEDITAKAEWTSSNADIVYVSKGELTAYQMGKAVIRASYGGKTTTVDVEVDIPNKLIPELNTITLDAGENRTISLVAAHADGREEVVTEKAVWTTADASVAKVENGTVTGVATGKTILTAKLDALQVTITVEVGYASEMTADAEHLMMSLYETKQVKLTATNAEGSTKDVTTEAQWTTNNDAVAIVSKGLITAKGNGRTNITAKLGGQAVVIHVEVDIIDKIEADVQALTLKSGEQPTVTVTVTLSNGETKDVTQSAEWLTGNYKVALVDKGQITAVAYGKTNITAKYGGKSVRIPVEVDKLKYLQTNVVNLNLKAGAQGQIKASATYFDEVDRDVTVEALWSSSNIMIASVKDGIVKANGKGKATITVKFGDRRTKVIVNVN